MRRVNWFVAAVAVGTLIFGCKAKEQTAETQPPEKPKAEAPARPKAETPAAAPYTRAAFRPGDTTARLSGKTVDGLSIEGHAPITVVP